MLLLLAATCFLVEIAGLSIGAILAGLPGRGVRPTLAIATLEAALIYGLLRWSPPGFPVLWAGGGILFLFSLPLIRWFYRERWGSSAAAWMLSRVFAFLLIGGFAVLLEFLAEAPVSAELLRQAVNRP